MSRAEPIAVLATLVIALAAPAIARADLIVAAPSCTAIDASEVQQILALELSDVVSTWGDSSSPVVLLGCSEGRIRIEINDPVTDKSVARTIIAPDARGAERVIALAIAQLFLTSWLELLVDESAAQRPGAEAAERRARDAIAAAEAEAVREEPTEEPRSARVAAGVVVPPAGTSAQPRSEPIALDLSISGGTRWRPEGDPTGTALGALRAHVVVDRALVVGAQLDVEWGRAFRTRGSIDLYTASLGLVAGWRTPSVGPFFVDVVAVVSAIWIALEGRPSSPDIEGGTTQAIAGAAALEVTPTLRVQSLIVALPLSFGGIAFAPHGEVTDERPVVVGGPVLSAMLRVGIETFL